MRSDASGSLKGHLDKLGQSIDAYLSEVEKDPDLSQFTLDFIRKKKKETEKSSDDDRLKKEQMESLDREAKRCYETYETKRQRKEKGEGHKADSKKVGKLDKGHKTDDSSDDMEEFSKTYQHQHLY